MFKCSECQTVSNPDAVKSKTPTFETKLYADSHQTEQTINVDEFPEPVTRSFLQAKILSNSIQNEHTKILDIGCFDGRLLLELGSLLSDAELWGFDINPHLEAIFPGKSNFHFLSSNLEDIIDSFDLITLSHSILYIPDLPKLMASIDRLLNNDGVLFIQIPDISKNPFYSLMGDQCFIFSQTSIINFLMHFGYQAQVVDNNYFPRELLITAKKERSIAYTNYKPDIVFEQNIHAIDHVKEQLKKITHQNLAVLGTTVNAAFVDEIIGDKIEYFVDENPSKAEKNFRGKKVLHPKDLNVENHTILPHGESGIKIKERFEKLYKGTFTVV